MSEGQTLKIDIKKVLETINSVIPDEIEIKDSIKTSKPPILKSLVTIILERHLLEKEVEGEYLKSVTFPKGSFDKIVKTVVLQRTTTPHGTEFLSSDAIAILNKMIRALEANDLEGFERGLKEFITELNKFPKPKDSRQESADVLVGAENLIGVWERFVRLIFEKTQTEVTKKNLRKFSGIYSNGTWGGATDNDGKPSSVDDFKEGIRRNAEGILRRYILELAVIRSKSTNEKERGEIDRILKKLIATTIDTYGRKTVKKEDDGNPISRAHIIENVTHNLRVHAGQLGLDDIYEELILPIFKQELTTEIYDSPEALGEELDTLADGKLSIEGNKCSPNKLAILIAGVQNYGFFAQKGEYRQNANVFRYVAQEVKELEKKLERPFKEGETLETALKDAIEKKLEDLEDDYYKTLEKIKKGKKITQNESNDFYFYDTLERLKAMKKDPDAFKAILIAECGSGPEPKSGEEKIAGGSIMKDFLATKYLADFFGVETPISPLIEYKAQIEELPAFVEGLLEQEKFIEYSKKHGLTLMIAGSDSSKSSSSSFTVPMQGSIITIQELCKKHDNAIQKLCKKHGIKLTVYYGAGSGLHRNANGIIPEGIDGFIRTVQGIEMRSGTLLTEIVKFVNQKINGLKDVQLTLQQAINDIGNNLLQSLPKHLQKHSAEERFNNYSEKYKSQFFAVFVKNCLPNAVERLCSFANRPASRPKKPGATGSEEPSTPQEEMRAIGYGQIFNDSGFGVPHLYLDLADIMGAQLTGYAEAEALAMTKELYFSDPYFRDTLNRAMENLALSNPDQGWKYVSHFAGFEIGIERNFEDFAILNIEGTPFSINDIVGNNKENRNTIRIKLSKVVHEKLGISPLSSEEDKEKATQVLDGIFKGCVLDLEHTKTLRALCQHVVNLSGGTMPEEPITQNKLIEELAKIDKPKADSLTKRLEMANDARKIVFKAHEKLENNETLDEASEREVYHAKGVLRQLFELVDPRLLVPQISPSKEVGLINRITNCVKDFLKGHEPARA
ncbi:MAG: hypothetical protein ACK5BE_06315 [Alphaproteobacteria bacterium]|jgi:hypothetical protein